MKNFAYKISLILVFSLIARLGMAQGGPFTTIGIIGSATPGAWDTSTPMIHGAGSQWTITMLLTQNEVKFRADDAWVVNWGAADFPSGTGTQGGANIPIPAEATYLVTFDDQTGAYTFALRPSAAPADLALAKGVSLSPNPAHEALTIDYALSSSAKVTITLHNALGQVVRQFAPIQQTAGKQSQPLPLSDLAAGLYLIQVQSGTQTQTARLVVE